MPIRYGEYLKRLKTEINNWGNRYIVPNIYRKWYEIDRNGKDNNNNGRGFCKGFRGTPDGTQEHGSAEGPDERGNAAAGPAE